MDLDPVGVEGYVNITFIMGNGTESIPLPHPSFYYNGNPYYSQESMLSYGKGIDKETHTVRPLLNAPVLTRKQEFLTKMADLLTEYRASIEYTVADDGIHLAIDNKPNQRRGGVEVFSGFLFDVAFIADLRNAAKEP